MKKLTWVPWLVLLTSLRVAVAEEPASTGAPTAVVAAQGKTLITADGAHLGTVYRVGADGSAQLIFEGKLVAIPADTLATVDGKLTTRLTKSEVRALH